MDVASCGIKLTSYRAEYFRWLRSIDILLFNLLVADIIMAGMSAFSSSPTEQRE